MRLYTRGHRPPPTQPHMSANPPARPAHPPRRHAPRPPRALLPPPFLRLLLPWRAHQRAAPHPGVPPAARALHLRGHTKVPQLHAAVAADEDVAGLDVAVDAALGAGDGSVRVRVCGRGGGGGRRQYISQSGTWPHMAPTWPHICPPTWLCTYCRPRSTSRMIVAMIGSSSPSGHLYRIRWATEPPCARSGEREAAGRMGACSTQAPAGVRGREGHGPGVVPSSARQPEG